MEVVLLEDVKALGKKGQIVKVKRRLWTQLYSDKETGNRGNTEELK